VPEPELGAEPELGPEPVLVPVAAETAEVTVPVVDVAADVTGAAAEVVLVPDSVLAAAEVPEPEPVPELVPVPTAAVPDPDPVLVPVTAEVTEPIADVTEPVAKATGPEPELVVAAVAAEVTEPEAVAVGGSVAACACRENTSKMTRIPAATIATCTARRAMCRKIGCGMSSSRTTGDGPDPARSDCYRRPGIRGHSLAGRFRPGSPGTGYLRSACKCTVRPPPYSTCQGQARDRGYPGLS